MLLSTATVYAADDTQTETVAETETDSTREEASQDTVIDSSVDSSDDEVLQTQEEAARQEIIDDVNEETAEADENGVEYSGYIVKLKDGTSEDSLVVFDDDDSVEELEFSEDYLVTES